MFHFFSYLHQTGTAVSFLLTSSSDRNNCTLSSHIFIRQEQLQYTLSFHIFIRQEQLYPFFSHIHQTGTTAPFLLTYSPDRNNYSIPFLFTYSSDRNNCTLSSHILIRQEQMFPFFSHIHQTGTNVPFILTSSSDRSNCILSSHIFTRQEQLYSFF
jgi:hypothetical protein